MLLVVGLGNPGASYRDHRHNIGFMAVDEIVRRLNAGPFRARFQGELAQASLGDQKLLFLKPQTYMNESGRSVGEAVRFYKLTSADVLVIHDELDLPCGKIRVKQGGGHGGHNGLRSIDAHLGADYRRLRVGIGHPGHKDRVRGYVLHDFSKEERATQDMVIDAIADSFSLLLRDDDAGFMNRVSLALAPPKPKAKPDDQAKKANGTDGI